MKFKAFLLSGIFLLFVQCNKSAGLESRLQGLETVVLFGAPVLVFFVIVLFVLYWKLVQQRDLETMLDNVKGISAEIARNEDKLKRINEGLRTFEDKITDLSALYKGIVDGIAKGNEELASGNFKMAELFFVHEIFKKPGQANAWVSLAHTYSNLKRYEEALDAIQMAIKLDKESPLFNKLGQISIIKAEILTKLGRCDEAVKVLKKEVLTANPDFKKAKELLDKCKKKLQRKA